MARCQATATVMWMPSMRASRAAGSSVASWNSAVERDCPGRRPSLAESFGESEGADGPAGLAAGEQPGRGAWVADGGVAAAGGDEVADEAGEGFGQHDGFAARGGGGLSSSLVWTWSRVRRLIAAGRWA